ncbi:hypothetical protein [Microcoleus sp. POL10_C6]|uniref:hypothetical protein n=1 Tax=Microcoleus sp. POL10_C6 TaxID=2818852 RepID=UPI002FD2DAA8
MYQDLRIKTQETGFLAASAICNIFLGKNPVSDHPLRCLETGFFTVSAGGSEETRKNPVSGPCVSPVYILKTPVSWRNRGSRNFPIVVNYV